jgi:Late exocytosis, associated with Golgi transport/Cytosolic domain of 10TM putative phosphate transporter
MSDATPTPDQAVVVAWTGIWVTIVVSLLQFAIFYSFFRYQSSKDRARYEETGDPHALDLYEPRQHYRAHRSPPPFVGSSRGVGGGGATSVASIVRDAVAVSDEETLRCVGLDAYMFLRILRLGARICAFGTALSAILLPVYATGTNAGNATEQFNLLTLAKVAQGTSWRIYVTALVWWIFVAAVLREFYSEWVLYAKNRADYLARGDPDAPVPTRYTILVEMVPENTDRHLKEYFGKLFPDKVLQTCACWKTSDLEQLIQDRQGNILKLEKATALSHAKPKKARPLIKVNGSKVDAMDHYQSEIDRLNGAIDAMRSQVASNAHIAPAASSETENVSDEESVEIPMAENKTIDLRVQTSTAFVTFSSLRAKQAAIQCDCKSDGFTTFLLPISTTYLSCICKIFSKW